jgi:hypothetical protein
MNTILRKDLEYVLPKLSEDERQDSRKVMNAIEGVLPERKGVYTLSEIDAALAELSRG